MNIIELKYSNTNTFLIEGTGGRLLFDTGWAGTFPAFCHALGEAGIRAQDTDFIMISHFHPDHMGIAEEIAELGPVIVVMDVQKDHIHDSDHIFAKEKNSTFHPIADGKVRIVNISESRAFLADLGIDGEVLHTPGHSDDSISLFLDDGSLFVGDLNPLYELELHRGDEIGRSWQKLLAYEPERIYYGHAHTAVLKRENTVSESDVRAGQSSDTHPVNDTAETDTGSDMTETDTCVDMARLQPLTERIMKYIDKGWLIGKIVRKTGADAQFVEDVTRMYLTHRNVSVQGILDRIEIKGR